MPVSMMWPPKVSRSTIAAHNRGSVKVLILPEKDSLDAGGDEGPRRRGSAGAGAGTEHGRRCWVMESPAA